MIRGKTLPKLLQQALTGGVTSTMYGRGLSFFCCAHSLPGSLFDAQGSLLAFAGEDINTNQMVAAIVANLWTSFENKQAGLETLLMDFDKGRVVATRTSQFVLCVVGTMQAPLGMLKNKYVCGSCLDCRSDLLFAGYVCFPPFNLVLTESKAVALAEYLQGPMDLVLANQ